MLNHMIKHWWDWVPLVGLINIMCFAWEITKEIDNCKSAEEFVALHQKWADSTLCRYTGISGLWQGASSAAVLALFFSNLG